MKENHEGLHFLPFSPLLIVRFGTHVCGGDTVSRPLHISNPTTFGKCRLIDIGFMQRADKCTADSSASLGH